MNKSTQLLFGVLVLGLLAVIAFRGISTDPALGGLENDSNSYGKAATYTSSTLNSGVKSLLPRATSTRVYARICNLSGEGIVWLHKQATSTGVAVNQGYPIFATSTSNYPQLPNCMFIDRNDPYSGQIWGVSSASTTVIIEYIQE